MQKFFSLCVLMLIFDSCGALPRSQHDDQSAPIINTGVSTTAMTGIVIQSTDTSYTSTAIYYYDLNAGKISLLTGAESGDTFTKWLDGTVYLFNRASGRVSYSSFAPKSGISSRSKETQTPEATAYDPTAAIIGPSGELILSMNAGAAVAFIDTKTSTVVAKLSGVDTGSHTQPFRPSELWRDDSKILVTHQALDASFKATGGGRIYSAASTNGTWNWASTSGTLLSISNPVFVSSRSNHTAYIGGVCYTNSGTSCVAGIDLFDMSLGQSTHISAWDASKWDANGGFYEDLSDDSLLACVREKSTQKNVVARYTIADGSMKSFFELSGSNCGGVLADRSSMKIFVGQSLNDGTGSITILDPGGAIQNTTSMTTGVSGLTASFD